MEKNRNKVKFIKKLKYDLKNNKELFFLVLPAFCLCVLFSYVPMYGVIMAFKEYDSTLGITASPFIGWENFERVFKGYYFSEVFRNTILISLFSLVVGFIFPVIFALLINNVDNLKFKKTIQLVSYAPYFISVVVIVSMLNAFFDPTTGVFMRLFPSLPKDVLTSSRAFKSLYVWSGLWQTLGWNCIIYISALSGVSLELYEAATIDGATKLQKITYIEIPSIMPTIIALLILSTGNIVSVGFEKTYLMQNANNISSSEVISTYVYKKGILSADYGVGTAVGLFNSIINFVMLVIVNFTAKKVTGYSIF